MELMPPPPSRPTRIMVGSLAALGVVALALLSPEDGPLPWRVRLVLEEKPPPPAPAVQAAVRELPLFRLSLGFEAYQKLEHKRAISLERGLLFVEEGDEVDGRLAAEGQEVDVKVRLKGDFPDHWQDPKRWSLRVYVKRGQALSGLRRFSLQLPSTRNGVWEWVAMTLAREEGLLAPRYRFVRLTINGEDRGVYALEEHFDKTLVESQQRREGPILRFQERGMFEEHTMQAARRWLLPERESRELMLNGGAHYLGSGVDAKRMAPTLADPGLEELFRKGVSLLDGFRRGELGVEEVFDVDRMARFTALLDLLGGYHGMVWHNRRYYLDPVSGLLEPVVYDTDSGSSPTRWLMGGRFGHRLGSEADPTMHTSVDERLFSDEAFVRAYWRELERLTRPGVLLAHLEPHAEELARLSRALGQPDPRETLKGNLFFARSVLTSRNLVRLHKVNEAGDLEVAVVHATPIELTGASCDGEELAIDDKQSLLPGRPLWGVPRFVPLLGVRCTGTLVLRHRVPGAPEEMSVQALPWPSIDDDIVAAQRVMRTQRLPGVAGVREFEGEVRVGPGRVRLDEPMVVATARRLVLEPGTELVLGPGAFVASWVPVHLAGTEEAPVEVRGEPGAGGLAVLKAGGRSALVHARFRDLAPPRLPGWRPTGGVTFYESPVDARDTLFSGGTAEDQLNLVRSEFMLKRVFFEGSFSDALDVDYGAGQLEASRFVRCGNDCIDVSETSLKVSEVIVTEPGDKGLSAGEASEVELRGLAVEGGWIGIASKDRSLVLGEGLIVDGAAYGAVAYQKKPEYGPASVALKQVRVQARHAVRVERGSRVHLGDSLTVGAEAGVARALEEELAASRASRATEGRGKR